MVLNAGKWAGLLSSESAPALRQSFAGMSRAGGLGTGGIQGFQEALNAVQGLPKEQQENAMQLLTFQTLLEPTLRQLDPAEQERQLELADKYQTRKGWKGAMFNTLTSGLENLTKGIAMSMNPYGTPEAARYAADITAAMPEIAGRSFQNFRTPYAIPGVQVQQAATYF